MRVESPRLDMDQVDDFSKLTKELLSICYIPDYLDFFKASTNVNTQLKYMLDPITALRGYLFVNGDCIETLSMPKLLADDRVAFVIGNRPEKLIAGAVTKEVFTAGIWLPITKADARSHSFLTANLNLADFKANRNIRDVTFIKKLGFKVRNNSDPVLACLPLIFPLPPESTAPSQTKLSDPDAVALLIESFAALGDLNPPICSWIRAMEYSFSQLNGASLTNASPVLSHVVDLDTTNEPSLATTANKIALEGFFLSLTDPFCQLVDDHIQSCMLFAMQHNLALFGNLRYNGVSIGVHTSGRSTPDFSIPLNLGNLSDEDLQFLALHLPASFIKSPNPMPPKSKRGAKNFLMGPANVDDDASTDSDMPGLAIRAAPNREDSDADSDDIPPLQDRPVDDSSSDDDSSDGGPPPLVPRVRTHGEQDSDSSETSEERSYGDDDDYNEQNEEQRDEFFNSIAFNGGDEDFVVDKLLEEFGISDKEALFHEILDDFAERNPGVSHEMIGMQVLRMTKDADAMRAYLQHRKKKQEEEERKKEQKRAYLQQRKKKQEEEERKREQKRRKEAEKKKKQKVRRKIFTFLKSRWEVKKCRKDFLSKKAVALWGQRNLRGRRARDEWGEALRERLAMAERYCKLWHSSIKFVKEYSLSNQRKVESGMRKDTPISWASYLESMDFVVTDDTNDETAKILNEAADKALQAVEEKDEGFGQVADDTDYDAQLDAAAAGATEEPTEEYGDFMGNHTNILYTENVKKWLRGSAGGRYRELFVKRMKQLSRGERSRILAKRLKGSSKKVTVYETYLEQKSGKRILWQIEGNNLLVWYVANHDNVSRLLKLIEDSENRKHRRLTTGEELVRDGYAENIAAARRSVVENEAILNPLGNNPLKVYEVSLEDVNELTSQSWVPKLRLTREEREVVETSGTVLLLGRSGTGKTICTANRMDYDRQQNHHDSSFTQLFVARSQQLCSYVENIIGSAEGTTFETYEQLKKRLEQTMPNKGGVRSKFPAELKMRFDVFKREVYDGGEDIDPLLVWTSIRSFIKGSIEAILKTSEPRAVSEDEFFDMTLFSSGRCSLTVKQRKIVYPIYERYVCFLREKNYWDDCDRILALLQRLQHWSAVDPEAFHSIQFSKIYVDEVQDYTQAECLLFFYLSNGHGNLFLAGDPAQNVVQGVEFRFQDIRSVEYHISKDKTTMMQKPKKVHVNFRSHAGILNTAGSILACMFKAYPKSAENLGEDHGVFVGPRPGVFENVEVKVLADLLSNKMNGTVVLVHDSTAEKWKKALDYPLIRTIRESKGLEYKSVIILDFFGDLCQQVDEPVQKAWRELLLRGDVTLATTHPEVESHLKLLYTAVTRCIEQLFFVETTGTIPGKAFVRWLTTTTTSWHKGKDEATEALATKNKVVDVQAKVMTKDEALQSGIQMATAAEGLSDLSISKRNLDQALYYFELADEPSFKKKVQVHKESVNIRSNLPPVPSRSNEKNADVAPLEQYRSLESNVARTVGKLFEEGLFSEGRDLALCIFPYIPTQTQQRLKIDVIAPLE